MARRLTEEKVTKAIINWLELNQWEIIAFDFPQSGTGISIHPDLQSLATKNKGAFIPDIVAIRNDVVVFFENKDKFVLADFIKIQKMKEQDIYSSAIEKFLRHFRYSTILFGIGLGHSPYTELKANENLEKVDFIIFCHQDNTINVGYSPSGIF